VFSTLSGYAAVAEVYLARWEQLIHDLGSESPTTRGARRAARRAVFDLLTLAVCVPIAWPCYYRIRGQAQHLEGKRCEALRAFERARVTARRLGMPHDEALAHLDLARSAPPHSPARVAHAAHAERMLEQLACPLDLERARDLHAEARPQRSVSPSAGDFGRTCATR
jgi:hypothetical protein